MHLKVIEITTIVNNSWQMSIADRLKAGRFFTIRFWIVAALLTTAPTLHGGKLWTLSYTPQIRATAAYNTNINTSADNPLADFLVGVRFEVSGEWPVTRFNTIRFDLGAGYRHYFRNSELNSSSLSTTLLPDLSFEFVIRVSDYMRIIVEESLVISRDPTDSIGFDDQGNPVFDALQFDRITNTLRATFGWEINPRTVAELSSSRRDVMPLDSLFDNTRQTELSNSLTIRRQLGTRFSGGVTAAHTSNRYRESFLNNSRSYSTGVFLSAQLTPHFSISPRVSYIWQDFRRGGLIQDDSDPRSVLWGLDIRHTPDDRLTYTLSATRAQQFGYSANSTFSDTWSASLIWTGFRISDVRVGYSHTRVADSGGIFAERARRNSFSVGLSRELGPGLSASLQYRFTDRRSSAINRTWNQHLIELSASYRF